jgi:hypothetical protein
MSDQRTFLCVSLILLIMSLKGCVLHLLEEEKGYMATVTVHISPQPIDRLRTAVLAPGGFVDPQRIEGADPNCSYFQKTLSRSGVVVSVHDCYGRMLASETGWGYQVSVSTVDQGRRPEVRGEIDELANQIRKTLQAQVENAKVTKESRMIGVPF